MIKLHRLAAPSSIARCSRWWHHKTEAQDGHMSHSPIDTQIPWSAFGKMVVHFCLGLRKACMPCLPGTALSD
jgi:hypothetical protein